MKEKLTRCINKKDINFIPIWFMRQAGRYLPEFREIRKKNQNFINLCLNPKLVTEITLQPIKRFKLDAAIIFSDILMIPYGLGQDVRFEKDFGPILGVLNLNKIVKKDSVDFIQKTVPVYKAINEVKRKLEKEDLVGFVGAPWTLLLYMLNRKSPKKNFNINLLLKDRFLVNRLLKKLEEIICLHINKQVEAGVSVVQIFDSWAGLLPPKDLPNYCYIPTLNIVNHLKSLNIPSICFPKGVKEKYEDFCSIVKPDCISLDYEVDPAWARKKLNNFVIQGGMDPKILLSDKDNIKKNVEKYLAAFKDHPYIFNLGHGILPETKPEIIEYIVKIIRDGK